MSTQVISILAEHRSTETWTIISEVAVSLEELSRRVEEGLIGSPFVELLSEGALGMSLASAMFLPIYATSSSTRHPCYHNLSLGDS